MSFGGRLSYPSLCLPVGGVMAADCRVVMDAWEGEICAHR